MTFGVDKQSGGGGSLGTAQQAAPAHPCYTVGAVGFGPSLDDDEDGWVRLTDKGWKSITDSMAASIVRLECEADELRAEVALLREQARIITAERDEARLQYGSTHALAEVLVKSRNEFLEALRDIANMDVAEGARAVWRAKEALK